MKCKCGFKFADPGKYRNCEAFITSDGQSGITCPVCGTNYVNDCEIKIVYNDLLTGEPTIDDNIQ